MIIIQGFLWHKDELEEYIKESRPELVCVTETHITEEITEHEIAIVNYAVVKTYTENKRTGGILVYIRNDMKFDLIDKVRDLGNEEKNMWLCNIKLYGKYRGLIISTLYHSPNQSHGEFINRLIEECENIIDKSQIIILGDFNIDTSKETQYSKKLLREMKSIGLKQLVKQYTRITNNSRTIIDLVFSNININTEIIETPRISDHFIVKVDVPKAMKTNKDNKLVIYKRDYSNYDEIKLAKEINEQYNHWHLLNETDVNERIHSLSEIIIESFNQVAPFSKKIIPQKWIAKEWFNDDIKDLIKQRDTLYGEAKRKRCLRTWCKYKVMRNETVNEIRRAKKKYYEKQIDNYKNNSKQMWKNLKSIIGDKNTKLQQQDIIFDDVNYSDEAIIAENFNKYFILSVKQVINEIKVNDKVEEIRCTHYTHSLDKLKEVSITELDNQI